MVKTEKDLELTAKSCAKNLEDKFSGANGKIAVLICSGTGCLATGAKDILETFKEEIASRGLQDKVEASKVGCFGFCSQGPFVKIMPKNIVYRGVKASDVNEILDKTVVGDEIIERLLYVDPVTKEKVSKLEDMAFYKKQVKVALYGCGIVNPEDINEALGYGAYQGLVKALKMDPQEVINEGLASGLRGRGGGGFPTGRKWQLDRKSVV